MKLSIDELNKIVEVGYAGSGITTDNVYESVKYYEYGFLMSKGHFRRCLTLAAALIVINIILKSFDGGSELLHNIIMTIRLLSLWIFTINRNTLFALSKWRLIHYARHPKRNIFSDEGSFPSIKQSRRGAAIVISIVSILFLINVWGHLIVSSFGS